MKVAQKGTPAPGVVGNAERRAGVIVLVTVCLLMSLWVADGLLVGRSSAMPIAALAAMASLAAGVALMWWVFTKVPYFAPIARTPRWAALLWGGLICVGPVLAIEDTALGAVSGEPRALGYAISALVNAVTEEVTKGLGVLVIFLLIRRPRTLVDGFVLGATVGLGFGFTEGTVYAVRSAWAAGSDNAHAWLSTALQRVLTDVLAGHWPYTAAVGAGLGYAFCAQWAGPLRRAGVLTGCLVLAIGLHALNDCILIGGSLGTLLAHVVVVVVYINVIAYIVVALLVMRWSRNREGEFYVSYLVGAGTSGVPREDLAALPHGATRRRERKVAAKSAHGLAERRTIHRAVRRVHRAEAHLAVAVATANTYASARFSELVDHRRAELASVVVADKGST